MGSTGLSVCALLLWFRIGQSCCGRFLFLIWAMCWRCMRDCHFNFNHVVHLFYTFFTTFAPPWTWALPQLSLCRVMYH